MKAVRVLGPGHVELAEISRPEPAVGEVGIRVLAVGICGTDIEIIKGHMAYYSSGMAAFPITIGHEWVGEVAVLGKGVTGLELGDRVVGEVSIGCMTCEVCSSGAYHRCATRTETGVMNRDGGLAEQIVLPARAVHKISNRIDVRAAALVEPTAIALNGVRLGGVGPTSQVAVMGDGPIGLLLLQVARAFGAHKVFVVGADRARLDLALRLGADAAIDARSESVPEALLRVGGGRRPTVVLEASGNPAAVDAAIAAAAPGATIVLQGLCGCTPPKGFDLDRIVINDLTLRGALGSPGIWPEVIGLIESGRIDPSAIVTHDLPMRDFARALEIIEARLAVKLLLRPADA